MAKRLDRDLHGTPPTQIGPVEERLNSFGNEGEVLGLVFGCFGEVSSHVRLVRDWIVGNRVVKELQWSCIHPKVLLARYRGRFDCCLGTLLQAGWARLILRRAHEEVLGPSAPQYNTTSPPGFEDTDWDVLEDQVLHL